MIEEDGGSDSDHVDDDDIISDVPWLVKRMIIVWMWNFDYSFINSHFI